MSPQCEMCAFDPDARTAYTWTHRVQSYSPTVNSIGTNGKNANKYRWWRREWEKLFGEWLGTVPNAMALRRVTFTRWYGKGNRAYDRRNFAGGCKPLLDTVVNYGALYDDSAAWVQDNYVQVKSTDGIDYIEVKIEELA